MKILYLTNSVQHPAMQSTFRHYYFLRELGRNHDITLLTLTKAPVPAAVLDELRSHAARVHVIDAARAARSHAPPLLRAAAGIARKARNGMRESRAVRDMRKTFLRLLREEQFDVVVLHGHNIFRVIDGWSDLPIVIDACDATSMLIRGRLQYAAAPTRPLHWLRYLHTRRIERRMLRATPHVSFISCRDREAAPGPASTAVVIPNAVDLDYWTRTSRAPEPDTLIFHGAMDYRPNVDAALQLIRKIMPRMRAVIPAVRLVIAGRDPAAELVDAGASAPGVVVTGRVEDVRPFLARACVYAAPLRFGAGQQNKLLEAMAMQVPIVTTSNGASGLRVGPADPPVITAERVEAFTDAVLRLLEDPAERLRLGIAGRSYIAEYFNVARSVRLLEDMCVAACGSTARATEQARAVTADLSIP